MTKTILITGASSGIGRASAKLFQSRGWNVVATMRDTSKESELSKLENTLVASLDVTDLASIQSAVDGAIKRFGQIDVLLNNAGYGAYGALEAFSIERIKRQFDTNVIGVLATTKAVLPHMRAKRCGTIVNVSSVGGKVTFPMGSLYHGTKFAVEGLSESLHYELEAIGVRVKIIEPGLVATDFSGRSFDSAVEEGPAEYAPAAEELGRLFGDWGFDPAPPESVAQVIFDAANDDSEQLRYQIGKDAEALIGYRKKSDDATFINTLKAKMRQ